MLSYCPSSVRLWLTVYTFTLKILFAKLCLMLLCYARWESRLAASRQGRIGLGYLKVSQCLYRQAVITFSLPRWDRCITKRKCRLIHCIKLKNAMNKNHYLNSMYPLSSRVTKETSSLFKYCREKSIFIDFVLCWWRKWLGLYVCDSTYMYWELNVKKWWQMVYMNGLSNGFFWLVEWMPNCAILLYTWDTARSHCVTLLSYIIVLPAHLTNTYHMSYYHCLSTYVLMVVFYLWYTMWPQQSLVIRWVRNCKG